MNALRQIAAVAAKDLRSEFRTKESINSALAFALMIIVLFSFVTEPMDRRLMYSLSGGLLWLVFAFSGALILNRSFSREQTNDCLDVLIASPVSGVALYLGKVVANTLFLLLIEAICIPLFGMLYNLEWNRQLGGLALTSVLATWGVTVVGTMFSALTVDLRLRELMLPMLVYPILIPALMSAMHLTTLLIDGQPMGADQVLWLRLLIGFDIIFTALALLLVDSVLIS